MNKGPTLRARAGLSRMLVAAALSLPIVVASLAFGLGSSSTAAPLNITQCVKQLNKCNSNCDRYPHGPFRTACYTRCASQHRRCAQIDAGTYTGKVETGPDPLKPKGGDTRGPFVGGILETGPVFNGQGPSATGSPGGAPAAPAAPAAPKAPPVILR